MLYVVESIILSFVDMAIVNSFILFQKYRAEHQDIVELQRKNTYSMVEFKEAIVRQICKLPDYDVPPVYSNAQRSIFVKIIYQGVYC